MVADAVALLLALSLWEPVTETAYDPAAANDGDVTCSVVDALLPALTLSAVTPLRFAVQPAGTVGARLKLDTPHASLLRLATVTVRLAAPPAVTDDCDGESVTVGGADAHDDAV